MLMVTSSSLCLLVVLQLSLKIPRMIKEFWGVFIRDNILRTFGFGGLSINFTKDLRSFLRRRGKKKQIATFSDAPKSEFMELICKKNLFETFFQDLIKRHDDDLNLKTPSGPQPHPSWVYRHNYAPFHSVARTATSTSTGGSGPNGGGGVINVKRSLSFLKNSTAGGSTLLKSQESGKPSIIWS